MVKYIKEEWKRGGYERKQAAIRRSAEKRLQMYERLTRGL